MIRISSAVTIIAIFFQPPIFQSSTSLVIQFLFAFVIIPSVLPFTCVLSLTFTEEIQYRK
jgi:hypothetical protein